MQLGIIGIIGKLRRLLETQHCTIVQLAALCLVVAATANNKEHKFVRSLNQHIQTSNILYQDAGTDSSSSLKHQLHSVNRFSGNRFSTDSRVFFALV